MLLTDWRAASALLVGWNVCTGLYLALAVHLMAKADVHQMRLQARLQDEGRFAILLLTAVAALTSLAATLHALAVYLLTPRKLSIEPSGWSRKLRTGSGLILFIEALAGPILAIKTIEIASLVSRSRYIDERRCGAPPLARSPPRARARQAHEWPVLITINYASTVIAKSLSPTALGRHDENAFFP